MRSSAGLVATALQHDNAGHEVTLCPLTLRCAVLCSSSAGWPCVIPLLVSYIPGPQM